MAEKRGAASWTEIIVFGASVCFAIIDMYSVAYFAVLAAIYLAVSSERRR